MLVNPGDDDDDTELSGLAIGSSETDRVNIVAAISAPPVFRRTLDGASTFEVEISDYRRKVLAMSALQGRVYAKVLGFNYDMVAVAKGGDRLTLTFEDSIVAALRRVTTWDGIPAGTVSRAEIVRRFCQAAGVSCLIDPGLTQIYNGAVEAPKADDTTTGWDVLRGLADDVDARCFSDGFNLHYGADAWLVTLTQPLPIQEFTGPIHGIDFDLDAGKPVSKATVEVDAQRWGLFAGRGVSISGLYWADGDWIVDSFERTLTSTRGKLELVRRRFVLAEPPPDSEGDEGEIGNVPTEGNIDISADLARLRQCESGGNYKTNTGNGFYGAYQFDQRTWSGLGYSGRPDQASPATQDEAAAKLYQQRGWAPWPACSKKLGLVDRRGTSSASTASGAAANSAREKFVSVALSASRGKPYVWGAKGPNSFDCSGLVQYASTAAGKALTAPSASQAQRVQKISVAEALKTRGALLFRIGKGDTNHVAISLGNGSTVEARGKAQGCGTFGGAAGRTWTTGGIWL